MINRYSFHMVTEHYNFWSEYDAGTSDIISIKMLPTKTLRKKLFLGCLPLHLLCFKLSYSYPASLPLKSLLWWFSITLFFNYFFITFLFYFFHCFSNSQVSNVHVKRKEKSYDFWANRTMHKNQFSIPFFIFSHCFPSSLIYGRFVRWFFPFFFSTLEKYFRLENSQFYQYRILFRRFNDQNLKFDVQNAPLGHLKIIKLIENIWQMIVIWNRKSMGRISTYVYCVFSFILSKNSN